MQDTVLSRMPIGIPGQLADLHTAEFGDVVSAVNDEAAAELPFGILVKHQAGAMDKAALPTAIANLLGVTVFAHNFAKPVQLGDTGVKPDVSLGVLRKGRIYVTAVDAVTPADEVHVRIGGVGQKGSFQKAAVVGETIDITAFAKWCGSAGAGGVVELEIDMTNAALATAD